METNNIYEEKIFSKWTTGIVGLFTIGFLFVLIYQIFVGPIGANPAPNWFFLLMFLLFLGVMINFNMLNIKMTPQFIIVGYGIFKDKIFWENIEDCYLDKTSAIRYGGWGIRIGRVNKKWRQVYNTPGEPRIVLSLKKGEFFKEFVFSTKNPEEVMKIIKERIKN